MGLLRIWRDVGVLVCRFGGVVFRFDLFLSRRIIRLPELDTLFFGIITRRILVGGDGRVGCGSGFRAGVRFRLLLLVWVSEVPWWLCGRVLRGMRRLPLSSFCGWVVNRFVMSGMALLLTLD